MAVKSYLPSAGFWILCGTLGLSCWFLWWGTGPVSYEKALENEQKGHRLYKAGRPGDALKYFLAAAAIKDDPLSRSRRYRFAGITAEDEGEKIKYFHLALTYNQGNQAVRNELKKLFEEVSYKDRWPDGWSKGNTGKISIDAGKKERIYIIEYFTNNSKKKEFEVQIIKDGNLLVKQMIFPGKAYRLHLKLTMGLHEIVLVIDDTFIPKTQGMNQDDRELGLHYEIIKKKDAIEKP